MAGDLPRPVHFREAQHFTQWWIWAVMVPVVFVSWLPFVEQVVRGVPFGDTPAPDWILVVVWGVGGVATPLVLALAHLHVEVDDREVRVAFRPFLAFRAKRYAAADLVGAEAIVFRPILDFGGWGIKHSRRLGWCYTVRGREGVRLDLADGKTLVVGSQRPAELAAALRRLREDA